MRHSPGILCRAHFRAFRLFSRTRANGYATQSTLASTRPDLPVCAVVRLNELLGTVFTSAIPGPLFQYQSRYYQLHHYSYRYRDYFRADLLFRLSTNLKHLSRLVSYALPAA